MRFTITAPDEIRFTTVNNQPVTNLYVNPAPVFRFKITGIVGVTYTSGGGGGGISALYIHNQNVPNSSWIINHNLGKLYPSVNAVIDSSGNQIEGGEMNPIDVNNLRLDYAAAFGGTAYLQ